MDVTQHERAILVGLELTRRSRSADLLPFSAAESIEELQALARGAGAEVAGTFVQTRSAPDAATLVGAGKVTELAQIAAAEEADVVVFDHDLSPTQLRNLEAALDCKVIDRTQLILDIFARRARTREGQLQVELAQLEYMLPRLTGRGTAMSRLGGGIGTRGPGETQLETDRRRISRRLQTIREQLGAVRRTREIQRSQRQGVPLATVAMVGYTNAGKSTLFNRLTGAAVTADARMFATLDPTARVARLPSRRRIVLSDTVGFIRNLPTTLVQAFRATLEEVRQASLLLHVVDASDAGAAEHSAHVFRVLDEIDAAAIPRVLVINKTDLLPRGSDLALLEQRLLAESAGGQEQEPVCTRAVAVSARSGNAVDRLLETIDQVLPVDPVSLSRFRFPATAGSEIHLLYECARVLDRRYVGEECLVEAEAPESVRRRLSAFLESDEANPARG